MGIIRTLAWVGGGVAVALIAGPQAKAQSLEVAPVYVELQDGAMAATVTVTNRGDQTMPVQTRIFAWDQNGGEDHLIATDAIMVSPPIIEVAPGVSQTIRLVRRRQGGRNEQSFRILVDQLPEPGETGNVRLRLRLSIPVFILSPSQSPPNLVWSLERNPNGEPGGSLVVSNNSGHYAKIVDLALSSSDGTELSVKQNVNAFVLAGVTRRWRVVGSLAAGAAFHLKATSESGPIDKMLDSADGP